MPPGQRQRALTLGYNPERPKNKESFMMQQMLGRVFSNLLHHEGIVLYSSAARDYIPAAVPSGAAQEARRPAGTLRDIQAVTESDFKFVNLRRMLRCDVQRHRRSIKKFVPFPGFKLRVRPPSFGFQVQVTSE